MGVGVLVMLVICSMLYRYRWTLIIDESSPPCPPIELIYTINLMEIKMKRISHK